MGLTLRCHNRKCRRFNGKMALAKAKERGAKPDTCVACGTPLMDPTKGKDYYVEYYDQNKKLQREQVGNSKKAAEQKSRDIKSAQAEGRVIKKSVDAVTRFSDLVIWWEKLPEVLRKRSYDRDQGSLKNLNPFFGDKLLKDIGPALVEEYRAKRLAEPSKKTGELTSISTVNKEFALIRFIFNKAIANGKAEVNPCKGVKTFKENNERDRVLTPEEYARLLAHSALHLKPIIRLAYLSALRQGEILNLTWGQVDLKEGFIRLQARDTKTNAGRLIPLAPELLEMFRAMAQGLPGVRVFTFNNRPINSVRNAFEKARIKAGIEDFTFHDLRHTAINNWRLQGHDYFRIMAASGHKTMSVFKRYSTVSKEELKALVNGGKS